MFLGMGALEFAIIIIVALLLFAPRLGKLGKGMRGARREFKRAASGDGDGGDWEDERPAASPSPEPGATGTVSAGDPGKPATGKGRRIVKIFAGAAVEDEP